MKYLFIVLSLVVFASCSGNEKETTPQTESTFKEDYEIVENQHYRQFYGGNDKLKIEGYFDGEGKRHGIWTSYTPAGNKQSILEYKNGIKDGFSVVYHENGSLYYKGEYRNDQMVGVWDYYDTTTGKISDSKDYGYPEIEKK